MANSIFMSFNGFADQGGGNVSTPGAVTAGSQTTGSFYASDGTALLPSFSYVSEPTLGIWRSGAGVMTAQGQLNVSGPAAAAGNVSTGAATAFFWVGRTILKAPADGTMTVTNQAGTAGTGIVISGAFQTATALVALGGGATATFGTIGGSGPATSAQNTWVRMLDSAGAAFWCPAWK